MTWHSSRYIFTKLQPRSPVIVQVLPLLYWSPSPLVRCLLCLRCLRCLVRCLASRDDCCCSRPTSCWRHCHGLSHPGLLQFVTTLQYNQLQAPVTWNCRMYTAAALWEIYEIQQDNWKNTSKLRDIDNVSFDSMIKDAWESTQSTSRSAFRMRKMAMRLFRRFNITMSMSLRDDTQCIVCFMFYTTFCCNCCIPWNI